MILNADEDEAKVMEFMTELEGKVLAQQDAAKRIAKFQKIFKMQEDRFEVRR